MTFKSVEILEKYFQNITEEEIKKDIEFIENIEFEGHTIEDLISDYKELTINNYN